MVGKIIVGVVVTLIVSTLFFSVGKLSKWLRRKLFTRVEIFSHKMRDSSICEFIVRATSLPQGRELWLATWNDQDRTYRYTEPVPTGRNHTADVLIKDGDVRIVLLTVLTNTGELLRGLSPGTAVKVIPADADQMAEIAVLGLR